MFSTQTLRTTLRDPNDDIPVAYDTDQNEIYHGGVTINYEGREIIWESFCDQIISLLKDEAGALTLARALDLSIKKYE